MKTFPFDDWLRAGVASGLSPSEVWASSLRDLHALVSRSDLPDLGALLQLFPDTDGNGDHYGRD